MNQKVNNDIHLILLTNYLALMAFDQNLLSLNHTEQQWDKHQYPFKEWNQDENLNSSMKYSVNWYYENLNKHLRQDEVKILLDQLNMVMKKYQGMKIIGMNLH